MDYFAGLDVSLEMTSICIVDADGVVVKEAKIASEPDDLVAFFAQCGMAMKRIGLEAGAPSQWLYGGMAEAELPVVCIEARHAKAALSAMPNKTDRNNARGIANIMRTGWFRAVHVKLSRPPTIIAMRTAPTPRRCARSIRSPSGLPAPSVAAWRARTSSRSCTPPMTMHRPRIGQTRAIVVSATAAIHSGEGCSVF